MQKGNWLVVGIIGIVVLLLLSWRRHDDGRLGLSERTHLSLWRLLKRLLFPTQTAEKRNARRKTSMRFHRVEVVTVTGSPPSGGRGFSPADGCGWGVFCI